MKINQVAVMWNRVSLARAIKVIKPIRLIKIGVFIQIKLHSKVKQIQNKRQLIIQRVKKKDSLFGVKFRKNQLLQKKITRSKIKYIEVRLLKSCKLWNWKRNCKTL